MVRENILTGEPINQGSPPDDFCSEAEAEFNASFGRCLYDPNYAAAVSNNVNGIVAATMASQQQHQQQPVFNNPYFNQNPMYANALRSSMPNQQQPQMMGYGIAPQQSQYGYGYYQQPGIGFGGSTSNGSPVSIESASTVAASMNPYMCFRNTAPKSEETYKYYVEPIKMNGDEIRYADQAERLDKIIDREVQRTLDPKYYQENYGRYYNNGYYGYYNNPMSSQIMNDFNQLKRENIENRKALDIKLSKLCHHYLNDGVTDEEIEKMYNGYYVDTGIKIQDCNNQRILDMAVPYDDVSYYRQRDKEINENFYKICGIDDPEHCGLEEFFDKIGAWGFHLKQEEIRRERREISIKNGFNMNAFRYAVFVKSLDSFASRRNFDSKEMVDKFNERYSDVQIALQNKVPPCVVNPAYAILDEENNVVIPDPDIPGSAEAIERLNQDKINRDNNKNKDSIVNKYISKNDPPKHLTEEEKVQIKKNLSQFPTLSNATISDDGTINIDFGYDIMYNLMKEYKDDIKNENEEQYSIDKRRFRESVYEHQVISPNYFPPPGTESPWSKLAGGGLGEEEGGGSE